MWPAADLGRAVLPETALQPAVHAVLVASPNLNLVLAAVPAEAAAIGAAQCWPQIAAGDSMGTAAVPAVQDAAVLPRGVDSNFELAVRKGQTGGKAVGSIAAARCPAPTGHVAVALAAVGHALGSGQARTGALVGLAPADQQRAAAAPALAVGAAAAPAH